MKSVLFMAVMLVSLLCAGHGALAIVSTGATTAYELRNTVVSGNFGGYKSGLLYLVGADGVRIAYPFEPKQELLRQISRIPLNRPLRLHIVDGQVVRLEEAR